MSVPRLQIHNLVDASSNLAKQQALSVLHRPEYHTSAISLFCRLQSNQFSAHSYLFATQCERIDGRTWLIAFVDRSRRPETELWLFGSWEVAEELTDTEEVRRQLHELFRAIADLSVPQSIHNEVNSNVRLSEEGLDNDKPSQIMLCGAIHERTYGLLRQSNLLSPPDARDEIGYQLFTFDIGSLPDIDSLREDLYWGPLERQHFAIVRSTSTIPRQERALAMLPSIAILSKVSNEPAGWGFVGLDGSLSTLYVMPDYRGHGLGRTLCLKLLRDKMDSIFEADEVRIGHSYVAPDNVASIRTAASTGGKKAKHLVYWLRVDLDEG